MAELLKKDKRVKVLELIRRKHEVSRAELSRLTGFTRPTISAIVNELSLHGLISETGKGESSGGKRPILLTLKESANFALGIDLADENCIRGVLCDINGEIVRKHEESYENKFELLLEQTYKVINTLMAQCDQRLIKGIGLAVSGVIDCDRNEVIHSSNFDIENRGIADIIHQHYGLPVFLANRPNAAALAEIKYGVGRKYRNLIYLTTGQGVGAGIIDNGDIYSGSFGAAGEIGKTIVDPRRQNLSTYPNDSTLEYRTRAQYILDEIRHETGRDLSYTEMLEQFQFGVASIEEKVFENARYLAYGASITANIVNPEVIILGGRIKEFGEKYLAYFRERFDDFLMLPHLPNMKRTEILVSNFGRDGIAFGGAVLVLTKIFNLDLTD